MTAARLPVTRALAALIAKATGRPCGIAELPRIQQESGEWEPAPPPYAILDSLPGMFSGPPLWDWQADAAWSYQVTSVGEREDQDEGAVQRAAEAEAAHVAARVELDGASDCLTFRARSWKS
ncbi:hypothetical protein GCM10010211_82270 [Streptomyces albospinus]|uniref:Uncharacterized protein n=1 Tax=Streptomyces albospinus TaxID=285515 RepID=A0ABQ2VR36_9ACTN|nr:hypothetical protein [Streptomyces albospinus]GGV02474.1 hypothetical protein GCM10010211_82270 [Streptomyces albospinus]